MYLINPPPPPPPRSTELTLRDHFHMLYVTLHNPTDCTHADIK
jgi:hypothetical protein